MIVNTVVSTLVSMLVVVTHFVCRYLNVFAGRGIHTWSLLLTELFFHAMFHANAHAFLCMTFAHKGLRNNCGLLARKACCVGTSFGRMPAGVLVCGYLVSVYLCADIITGKRQHFDY